MSPFDMSRALRAWADDLEAFGLDFLPRGAGLAPGQAAGVRVSEAESGRPSRPAVGAPGAGGRATPGPAGLDAIAAEICACNRCPLGSSRTRAVPGQGAREARILFVGEAPGAEEDRTGLAFVGRAGELLTRMIRAMGLGRDEVFIANVIKCRPPENRDPRPDEVATCLPYLERQLDLIGPEVIVALGAHAARSLLGTDQGIGRLRGRVHTWRRIPVVPTYHPAYLLRYPEMKQAAWQDLQLALGVIGLEPPRRGSGGSA